MLDPHILATLVNLKTTVIFDTDAEVHSKMDDRHLKYFICI